MIKSQNIVETEHVPSLFVFGLKPKAYTQICQVKPFTEQTN